MFDDVRVSHFDAGTIFDKHSLQKKWGPGWLNELGRWI